MYSPDHEPLTPEQVLAHAYFTLEGQAKAEGKAVKEFSDMLITWASYWDFGTISSLFRCDGFIREIEPGEGLVVAFGRMIAREEIKTFERALVLAKISTGGQLETAPDNRLERFLYGSREKSWADVGERHIGYVLPGNNLATKIGAAVLFVKDHRLMLNGYEVDRFIVEAPKYNSLFRRGTGAMAGMIFVKDEFGREPESGLASFIPLVDKPARYDPRVVDYLIGRVNQRISFSTSREIEQSSKNWLKEDQRWIEANPLKDSTLSQV